MLLAICNARLIDANRDWFSIGASAIMVPIAYGWRRSPRFGFSLQLGILGALLVWCLIYDPAIVKAWWSYAGKLAVLCSTTAAIVSVLLWIFSVRRVTGKPAG